MIVALVVALTVAPPESVYITTSRGDVSVPVRDDRGPAISAALLSAPLGLTVVVEGGRATVVIDGAGFVFALDAPYAHIGTTICPMSGETYVVADTLYLPLAWLSDCIPKFFSTRYRWDAAAVRLSELPQPTAVASSVAVQPAPPPAAAPVPVAAMRPVDHSTARPTEIPNPRTGLRRSHVVVVDPGHGGVDPGNPGRYFPNGMTEKDVNLMIGRLLRAELERRGITALLTRSTDTLIDLADRPRFCHEDCDLFVSVHVNAMPDGRKSGVANGVETYYLSDAKTEDQRRVAQMENDALRFETPGARAAEGDVAHILRDLQQNEYLRESARFAALVQHQVATVHPGEDRGVQQAGFYVLNGARRPAILVETGFSTNKSDGAYLASALGQRKIANAIADGIVAYLLEFERKVTVSNVGSAGAAR
jgi:N-acetylmuramoyl-L-alanine amidase